jgi:predicted nucleic acid-binding protein
VRRVFADAFYFFAMLNERDEKHSQAIDWTRSNRAGLVTTEWVLLELADGLAGSPGKSSLFRTREALLADPQHLVIPLEMSLHEEGLRFFQRHADKQWSLTDCISFIVMRRQGLTDALTGDHHFEQAGFRTLLS